MSTNTLESPLTYEIRRSRRKTAAIHVTPAGIEVRVPYGVSQRWVNDFVMSRSSWIQKTQAKLADQKRPDDVLGWDSELLWSGKCVKVRYSQAATRSTRLIDQTFLVSGRTQPTLKELRLLLEQFFKDHAKQTLIQLTQARALQLGVQDKLLDIRFRRTKTKWGHCTSQGRIQYNWQIMGAPLDVQDYLVCHEVSHLIHGHHGPEFWQCVAQLCPDYQKHRQWLKEFGFQLQW